MSKTKRNEAFNAVNSIEHKLEKVEKLIENTNNVLINIEDLSKNSTKKTSEIYDELKKKIIVLRKIYINLFSEHKTLLEELKDKEVKTDERLDEIINKAKLITQKTNELIKDINSIIYKGQKHVQSQMNKIEKSHENKNKKVEEINKIQKRKFSKTINDMTRIIKKMNDVYEEGSSLVYELIKFGKGKNVFTIDLSKKLSGILTHQKRANGLMKKLEKNYYSSRRSSKLIDNTQTFVIKKALKEMKELERSIKNANKLLSKLKKTYVKEFKIMDKEIKKRFKLYKKLEELYEQNSSMSANNKTKKKNLRNKKIDIIQKMYSLMKDFMHSKETFKELHKKIKEKIKEQIPDFNTNTNINTYSELLKEFIKFIKYANQKTNERIKELYTKGQQNKSVKNLIKNLEGKTNEEKNELFGEILYYKIEEELNKLNIDDEILKKISSVRTKRGLNSIKNKEGLVGLITGMFLDNYDDDKKIELIKNKEELRNKFQNAFMVLLKEYEKNQNKNMKNKNKNNNNRKCIHGASKNILKLAEKLLNYVTVKGRLEEKIEKVRELINTEMSNRNIDIKLLDTRVNSLVNMMRVVSGISRNNNKLPALVQNNKQTEVIKIMKDIRSYKILFDKCKKSFL